MIINLLFNLITGLLGVLFSWLPQVTTFPTINGFDIDGALVSGMGTFNAVATVFWPLAYLMQGFLFIMGYFLLKMTLKFFLGHRAPVH